MPTATAPAQPPGQGPCRAQRYVQAMEQAPTTDRRIEYVRLDALPDHPHNPRNHNLDDIRASVVRFGFTTPPLVDGRTGLLAEGHGRKKAALELESLGAELPDGVHTDPDGRWLVPVVHGWSSTDDTEALAYLLAGNIGGDWATDLLVDVLGNLAETDALDGTGFTVDDYDTLATLINEQPDDPNPDTDDDGLPPDPPPARDNQGLHEVNLTFQTETHRRYQSTIIQLKDRWQIDTSPLVVLRAMEQALATPDPS